MRWENYNHGAIIIIIIGTAVGHLNNNVKVRFTYNVHNSVQPVKWFTGSEKTIQSTPIHLMVSMYLFFCVYATQNL